MWITMCKTIFPKCSDVDNFVENYKSYPQENLEYVDN